MPGRGGYDWVLCHLAPDGKLLRQWRYGGTRNELYPQFLWEGDKFTLIGTSSSGKGFEKSEWYRNLSTDFWILQADLNGNKIRDRTIGGSLIEKIPLIRKLPDKRYLIAGTSLSPSGYEKTDSCRGGYDYWFLVTDSTFQNILWQTTVGGTEHDYLTDCFIAEDGSIYACGLSFSDIGGDKQTPGRGKEDYWVVKLKPDVPMALEDLNFKSQAGQDEIYLNWVSSLQNDGDYYLLERCDKEGLVTQLLTEKYTSPKMHHSYRDKNPECGNQFYRLSLYDAGGALKVRRYTMAGIQCEGVSVSSDGSYLFLRGIEQETTISIFDLHGRWVKSITVSSGTTQIDTEHLASGIYFLKINNQIFKIHVIK